MGRPSSFILFGSLILASSFSFAFVNSPESICLVPAYRELAEQAMNLGCSMSTDLKSIRVDSREILNDRLIQIDYSAPRNCPKDFGPGTVSLVYDQENQSCR